MTPFITGIGAHLEEEELSLQLLYGGFSVCLLAVSFFGGGVEKWYIFPVENELSLSHISG